MILNQSQVLSILRAVVPALVAYLVGRGWISESAAGEVAAAIVTLLSAGWGSLVHTDSAKIAEVEALPDVKKIVVTPGVSTEVVDAARDPSRPKVVMEPGVTR